MSDTPQPRNRRERRAAAREASKSGSKPESTAEADIPMIMPDYDAKPSGKTLLDIADERRAKLQQGETLGTTVNREPADIDVVEVLDKHGDWEFMSDEPLGAFANALLYCLSLSMLHVTLDVLVLTQYRQDVVWSELAARMSRMTPALFFVLWLFHTNEVKKWKILRQIFFLVLSTAAGVFLIYNGNEQGYYFVMKRAPPVGTLWVWSVVEMELMYSLVHVVTILGYMWWNGFSAF